MIVDTSVPFGTITFGSKPLNPLYCSLKYFHIMSDLWFLEPNCTVITEDLFRWVVTEIDLRHFTSTYSIEGFETTCLLCMQKFSRSGYLLHRDSSLRKLAGANLIRVKRTYDDEFIIVRA